MNSPTTASPNASLRHAPDGSWAEWWRGVRLPAIVFGVLAVLILMFIYFQFTLVTGTELNSRTWQLRDFSFRRDPFTNLQLTGIKYGPSSVQGCWADQTTPTGVNTLPATAIAPYLTAKLSLPPRWDLVRIYDRIDSVGRASILVRLVEANSYTGTEYWQDWSLAEPKKAAVLWPAAQRLVATGMYAKLPELFELPRYQTDDANFAAAVAKLTQAALAEQPQQAVAADETKSAAATDEPR